MGKRISKYWQILVLLLSLNLTAVGQNDINYYLSLNYYRDLSDTYDGGDLFSGEFKFHKSFFGAHFSFGYFQSHSVFKYQIVIDEINKSVTIPFDEISIMKSGSVSLIMVPIQSKLVIMDLICGVTFSKAQRSQFQNVEYSYSFTDNKFNYLYKNYEYSLHNHFGIQFGFNLSFFVIPKIAIELSTRIQDLSNGGTFFFIGTGLSFKL